MAVCWAAIARTLHSTSRRSDRHSTSVASMVVMTSFAHELAAASYQPGGLQVGAELRRTDHGVGKVRTPIAAKLPHPPPGMPVRAQRSPGFTVHDGTGEPGELAQDETWQQRRQHGAGDVLDDEEVRVANAVVALEAGDPAGRQAVCV